MAARNSTLSWYCNRLCSLWGGDAAPGRENPLSLTVCVAVTALLAMAGRHARMFRRKPKARANLLNDRFSQLPVTIARGAYARRESRAGRVWRKHDLLWRSGGDSRSSFPDVIPWAFAYLASLVRPVWASSLPDAAASPEAKVAWFHRRGGFLLRSLSNLIYQ